MASKERVAAMPEFRLRDGIVKIEGVTPLLMNRFGEKAMSDMEAAQTGAAKLKKEPRDPDRDFREALHVISGDRFGPLENIVYGFPATAMAKAIVSAGQRFADEVGTKLRGAFSIPVELIQIDAMPPTRRTDYVRLSGINRTASLAYRPQFFPWSMEVPVKFNEGYITLDQLLNLVRLAGFSVGIGCWRTENKGTMGQFVIKGYADVRESDFGEI